jgi:DNA (cytosine-5)-methyltransferase 1
MPVFIPDRFIQATHASPGEALVFGLEPAVTLGEAIGDLPEILAGDEAFERDYDVRRRKLHLEAYGSRYTFGVLQAHKAKTLTGHAARPHSMRDRRDFERLREGETSKQALARGVEMEFPYDRKNFKDRYTRQHRDQLCSTIVAHLKKDGLMFIHPTQTRSLTPREAARIQSFPDTFKLPTQRTEAYAAIGNAVPPLIGKAIGVAVVDYLITPSTVEAKLDCRAIPLPEGRDAAISQIEEFAESLFLRNIKQLSAAEFLEAWWAIGYLHPHLHPDAALDNGKAVSRGTKRGTSFVLEPIYVQSGWPVELVPISREARRRFEEKLITEDEYYCSTAMVAGAAFSNSLK